MTDEAIWLLCVLGHLKNDRQDVMSRCGASHLLSFLKHPEERSHGADVEGMCGDGHDVVQDASHLPI